jgi:hypothetical protein
MASGWQTLNGGSVIDGTFKAGADSFFEKVRAMLNAAVFVTHPLGGSRAIAIAGTGYQDAIDYISFTMPDAASSGGVWNAVVELLCENVATTITPKIRNVTDATDAVIGSAHASTSWGTQTLSFTPVAGKTYRLMAVKSDDLFQAWAIGVMRRTNA